MPLPRYEYTGPVDHTAVPDRTVCRDQSVIITGGANGIGEECVRQYVAAGAFVTFGDMNDRGFQIQDELNKAHGRDVCVFVKVDIRDWEQQKAMFETAKSKSPHNSVDVVIANAGISRSSGDSLWNLDGESLPMLRFYAEFPDSPRRSKPGAHQARSQHCPRKCGRHLLHVEARRPLFSETARRP